MELEKIILSEVAQTQKDKCHMSLSSGAPGSKSSEVRPHPGVTTETKKLKEVCGHVRDVGDN